MSRGGYAVSDSAIAARRRELAESVAAQIGRSGVAALSLSTVAKQAGVSVGQLQHHFGSRSQLIKAAVAHRLLDNENEWRELARGSGSPLSRVRALLRYSVAGRRNFADGWGFWLEVYSAARHDDGLRQEVNTALDTWRVFFVEVLQEAIETGAASSRRPAERQATWVLALIDGLAQQVSNGTYGLGSEDMDELLLECVGDLLGVDQADWSSDA